MALSSISNSVRPDMPARDVLPDSEIVSPEALPVDDTEIAALSAQLEETGDYREFSPEMQAILDTDNIATIIDAGKLAKVASSLQDAIQRDTQTMADYKRMHDKALKIAKMSKDCETKTFPFPGASMVMMPYLADAALEFSSRFTPDVLAKNDICFAEIVGTDAQFKADKSKRVTTAINYDLNCGIKAWAKNHDLAMFNVPITGMIFKKTYQCPVENHRKSDLIFGGDMIYDHNAKSFECAPRKSHEFTLRKNQVVSKIRQREYLEIDYNTVSENDDKLFSFIECHCRIDLDGDDYAEPYIVTIYTPENKIVSIVKRFAQADIKTNDAGEIIEIESEKFFTQIGFIPDPEKPAVYLGFGILLSDLFETINTNTQQMIDAGTMQNTGANSGFVRKGTKAGERGGNRVRKGSIEIQMGKFVEIETSGNNPLKDDLVNFPFGGPSQSLFNLITQLKEEARTMTQISFATEANAGEAAELYLARLQQGMKKPNAIMLRVYEGMTAEFKRIFDLQKRYLTDEEYEEILGIEPVLRQEDVQKYMQAVQMWKEATQQGLMLPEPQEPVPQKERVSVEEDYNNKYVFKPTADPSQGSEHERIARKMMISQRAQQMPQLYNVREAEIQLLEEIGTSRGDVEKLLPPPDPNARDPMAEMQKEYLKLEATKAQLKAAEVSLKAREQAVTLKKVMAETDKLISETAKNYAEIDAQSSEKILGAWDRMRQAVSSLEMPEYEMEAPEAEAEVEDTTGNQGD